MATKSFGVSLNGFHFEDWQFSFNLAAGITKADIGKAVTLDTSAANTVKLAGDGDVIHGRLEVVEDRSQEGSLIGNVAWKFIQKLPVKSGETVALGDLVQGAGSGEVKALAVSTDTDGTGTPAILAAKHMNAPRVVEVLTGYVVVIKE